MKFTGLFFLLFQILAVQVRSSVDVFPELQLINDSLKYKEKVYLHLDKSYYNVGEDIWFKAYLVNAGTHRQGELNNVLYVDIIDSKGAIKDSRIIKIENGAGYGDFVLPNGMPGGEYTIRAYTNYMRNFDVSYFFRKRIYINALPKADVEELAQFTTAQMPKQGPDLQFFPEGGQMVNGYFNRVGFKVIGFHGKGLDISGIITDGHGVEVSKFSTSKFGMGMINLKPDRANKNRAVLDYNGKSYSYDIPKGRDMGTLFRVQELKDHYQVGILSTIPDGIKGFRIIGAYRNGILYDAKIKGEGNKAVIKVKKDLLATGIVRFTLLDQNAIAICERLVFYDGDVSPKLETVPSSNNYSKEDMVELKLDLDREIAADLSLSVTDVDVAQPREGQPDLRTYLLLDLEIKGEIESPGYYFYSDDPQRRRHLDFLMMTQGWRQFILDDTGKNNGTDLDFFSETGITIEGNVLKGLKGKRVGGAHVTMTYWDEGGIGKDKMITDANGHFKFLGLDFMDESSLVIEAKDHKSRNSGLFVELDSIIRPSVASNGIGGYFNTERFELYMNDPSNRKRFNESLIPDDGVIELDEVEVQSRWKELSNDRTATNSLHRTANNTLDFRNSRDKSYSTLPDALRSQVSGVSVIADTIVIRGRGSFSRSALPLFLLDGVPVEYGAIKYLSTWEVDFVDVLKGAKAAIYGSRGANGVIAIYTATANDESATIRKKNPDRYIHEGFYPRRKFYNPVFGDFARTPKKEYGSTLFWEPTVTLEATGKSKISFPAGTRPGVFKAVLQGLTTTGVPLYSEALFTVE